MYPASEAFLQAVQENVRRYYRTGKNIFTNATAYTVVEMDVRVISIEFVTKLPRWTAS